jgi:hypothetical protein
MKPNDGDPMLGPQGLTLRDWLAGQALLGILTHYPSVQMATSLQEFAASAYKAADAMLAQRDKETTNA